MIVLGIESSCDETGVGIIELSPDGGMEIRADVVASSMEQHARFGGVVPEIASRAHLEAMPQVMEKALAEAGVDKPDAVAATVGPGLAGALLVGASAAKAYAAAWGVPFYGVNHLGGHVAVANLDGGEELPHSIALLVSGGHTQILEVDAVGKPMKELGSTLDDAAGEAYDKVSRLLGLGYPGGPVIDRLAKKRRSGCYPLPPRPVPRGRPARGAPLRFLLLRAEDRSGPIRRGSRTGRGRDQRRGRLRLLPGSRRGRAHRQGCHGVRAHGRPDPAAWWGSGRELTPARTGGAAVR